MRIEVEGSDLPAPMTLGADTIDAALPFVRVSVALRAADGELVLTITRADALGFGWFGVVRTKAAELILKALSAYPVVAARKGSDGNLRVRLVGWEVAEAGVSAGEVRVRLVGA